MDIFKIESSTINSSLVDVQSSNDVSFDAGSEFNLNFFDTPEDSSTQGIFSDPGSVESSSPPPSIKLNLNNNNQLLHSNSLISVKTGKKLFFCVFLLELNMIRENFGRKQYLLISIISFCDISTN